MTRSRRPQPEPEAAQTEPPARRGVASTSHLPPLTSGVIVRRRLFAVLRQGLHGPLTLVAAPAGYGKTVLVASWLAQEAAPGTVVYTTLDDDAVSPVGFWATLLEGLQGVGVDVSGVHAAGSTDVVDRPMLARLAQRIAAHADPVVWVLDCGEYALPRGIADGLHRLMTRCAGGLRVVLLTRTDPPLPLHRYGLDGALTEIRAADLSFTATEASTLLQRAGLSLAPPDVDWLRVRTRGWPAGLRFAAMSLAGRADTQEAIREFRGDTQNVAGYLMTEVLAKQPPAMREFLLRTCLADQLEPGIVEALTGQPSDPRVLEFLARGNSFVEPVPGRPGHYRYQPLFREFLRSQLSFENPVLASRLHREAADWLAQNGRPLAAIRHAVSAQAWRVAARHFVEGLSYSALLTGRQRRLLDVMLASLPVDTAGVEAALMRAAFALADLDSRRAALELDAARTLLDGATRHGSRGCAHALTILDAVAASLGTDLQAALDAAIVAEHALQQMPSHDDVAYSELVAIVAGCKARVLVQLGDFAGAQAALDEGGAVAQDPRLGEALAGLRGMSALVEAMAGHLRRAVEVASPLMAATDGDSGRVASTSRAATLAVAWVRVDEYDLGAAEHLISSLEGTATSLDAEVLQRVAALLRARLLTAREEYDLAGAELRAVSTPAATRSESGWLDRSLIASRAALLVAQGQPEAAITMMQSTVGCEHMDCGQVLQHALLASGRHAPALAARSTSSIAMQPLTTRVTHWLVEAEQSIQEGDLASGQVSLETALQLAAPEHLRRPFLETSHGVRELLERSGLLAVHHWLQPTLSAAGEDAARASHGARRLREDDGRPGQRVIVNPLTRKEQEVLGYLADLLTTEEIAGAMFVSVNTVRSHVRSILRKLTVARRNEAVRRAWELGLLPPRDAA